MKKSEIKNGAVVVLRNGNVYLKVDNTLLNLKELGCWQDFDDYKDDLTSACEKDFDIIKVYNDVENTYGYCPVAIQQWLNNDEPTWERPKDILDDKEKEYLSQVIKPFREKVKYICKRSNCFHIYEKSDYIKISLKNNGELEAICLPKFSANTKSTMYKGMETDKIYTLEELDL